MPQETPIEIIKHMVETGVADGATFEKEWTPSEGYVIEKIIVSEEGANDLTHTDATIRIGGEPKTKDETNIQLWQCWYENAPYLGWELPADTKFYLSVTSHEGAARSYNFDIYCSSL